MTMPAPTPLPASLTDYLPGRIHVVDAERWPTGGWEATGVRVFVPRYGLEVFVRDAQVDPERVQWHARRTVHPIETAYVSLLHDRRLYVLRGRHLLAAHLAAGSDRIPVQLFQRVPADTSPGSEPTGDTPLAAHDPAHGRRPVAGAGR